MPVKRQSKPIASNAPYKVPAPTPLENKSIKCGSKSDSPFPVSDFKKQNRHERNVLTPEDENVCDLRYRLGQRKLKVFF